MRCTPRSRSAVARWAALRPRPMRVTGRPEADAETARRASALEAIDQAHERKTALFDAQEATLRQALAGWKARAEQVQNAQGGFAEVNPATGKGIRTSDADRQKFEVQRAAELARVAGELARTQREMDAVIRFRAEADAEHLKARAALVNP